MSQQIHDPNFYAPHEWDISPGFTVGNGQLDLAFASDLNYKQRPAGEAVIGKRYNYFVKTALNTASTFRIFFGGELIYDEAVERAIHGEFVLAIEKSGSIVASSSEGLRLYVFNAIGTVKTISVIGGIDDVIDHDEIRRGIRALLVTVPGLPASRSWENRDFKPPQDASWVRETLLPGTERQISYDAIQSVGIYQLDLFWPANDGTEEPENLADLIKATFQPTISVSNDASIYRAERFPGTVDDDKWFRIPIRLSWRAYSFG